MPPSQVTNLVGKCVTENLFAVVLSITQWFCLVGNCLEGGLASFGCHIDCGLWMKILADLMAFAKDFIMSNTRGNFGEKNMIKFRQSFQVVTISNFF